MKKLEQDENNIWVHSLVFLTFIWIDTYYIGAFTNVSC
jgi:hypothetical protein